MPPTYNPPTPQSPTEKTSETSPGNTTAHSRAGPCENPTGKSTYDLLARNLLEEPTTPGPKEHLQIDELLLGYKDETIHQAIDLPHTLEKYKKILGKENVEKIYKALASPDTKYKSGHRQAFHTLLETMLIGYLISGPKGARIGMSHWIADEYLSDKQTKKILETLTNKHRK